MFLIIGNKLPANYVHCLTAVHVKLQWAAPHVKGECVTYSKRQYVDIWVDWVARQRFTTQIHENINIEINWSINHKLHGKTSKLPS